MDAARCSRCESTLVKLSGDLIRPLDLATVHQPVPRSGLTGVNPRSVTRRSRANRHVEVAREVECRRSCGASGKSPKTPSINRAWRPLAFFPRDMLTPLARSVMG